MKKNSVKYKVGDKVRLVSKRPGAWNFLGEMDHYLGNEVIITRIDGESLYFIGSDSWAFMVSDIECKVDTYEPPDHSQFVKACIEEMEREESKPKTYIKLKSLSPESILANDPKPCKDQFRLYLRKGRGMFFTDRYVADVLNDCADHKEWLPWLIKYGYIKERRPPETEHKFYATKNKVRICY